MNTSTSIFKFATIRNQTDESTGRPEHDIQPSTALARSLVEIIESDKKQPEKIAAINQKLEGFIKSKSFFRTKTEVAAALGNVKPDSDAAPVVKRMEVVAGGAERPDPLYEILYDNVLVRTLTKSTRSEVFGLLTNGLKKRHQRLNEGRIDGRNFRKLRIILPEGLVLSFSPPDTNPAPAVPPTENARAALLEHLRDLTEQKRRLQKSVAEYESQIAAERRQSTSRPPEGVDLQAAEGAAGPGVAARGAATRQPPAQVEAERNPALDQLLATVGRLKESEAEVNARLTELNRQILQATPRVRYVRIGDRWVGVGETATPPPPKIEGDAIMVYSDGCYLKFPFQVADLRVVEQQSVGYLPAEIAHINNTQQGELNEKVTRRKTVVESFESLLTEDETFHETDSQSTEKFTVQKAGSEVQSEESTLNVGTSVSGTYGVVTASVDAGYSSSQSSQSANSSAQSYAREIVERVVDRVSTKVRKERSTKRVEEFEEMVKHVIDNRKSTQPKSYVYRWLTRLCRATLKNYGMRLIFQFDVAHPPHDYLSRAIQSQPGLTLPADPRRTETPGGKRVFNIEDVTRENYLAFAEYYGAKLEPPPDKKILVSYVNAGKSGEVSEKFLNPIPDGYRAYYAYIEQTFCGKNNENYQMFGFLSVLVGRTDVGTWVVPGSPVIVTRGDGRNLNHESKFLPISIVSPYGGGFAVNIEIECELTEEGERAWQTKCYNAILEAYDNQKVQAENKMSDFDPNLPGLHPLKKRALIKTELKKGALSRMFRCNPFWITDDYEVGKVYDPDCCKDSLNGETIRFLETLFDWDNMTYELYPYLYADRDNWSDLLDLTDDDPHFEAFLQSSYATVRVPVYRDSQKERAAVNFILNNSIANYDVVPASMKPLLDELDGGEPTKFTTGLDGEELAVPTEVVDLGIFTVPTDLVILECGVENGIKPIGFPQKALEGTDVSIPQQYSPAIIADRCAPAPANPVDPDDPVGEDNPVGGEVDL